MLHNSVLRCPLWVRNTYLESAFEAASHDIQYLKLRTGIILLLVYYNWTCVAQSEEASTDVNLEFDRGTDPAQTNGKKVSFLFEVVEC